MIRLPVASVILSCAFWYRYGLFAVSFSAAPCRIFCGHERRIARHRRTPVLDAAPNNDDTDKDGSDSQSPSEGDAMSLDQQKLSLENMIQNISDQTEISNKHTFVLTTSRKKRLEREIELLKRLDPAHPDNNSGYSDLQNQELVVSELWSLWYGERGPLNEKKLHEIEEKLVDPSQWPGAEKQYLDLIREHCSGADGSMDNLDLSNWVEPANRLATLLFLMGRLNESKQWCERILLAKPWHIGALSGIVMVCMKMSDEEGAIKYSLMGLPNLSAQMRNARVDWVKRNVQLAEKNLLRLEELNREAYGEPDNGGIYAGYLSSTGMDTKTEKMENDVGSSNSEWQ
jgi:hypothetical protein